ncbi:hypothetical protein B0H19DRAFT_1252858 [Mycena capillaripes]|nr:hypothetical protein B0H19DRAFT_1252858 [Mycena capillaripes]
MSDVQAHTARLIALFVNCVLYGILLTTFVPCLRSLLFSASQKFQVKSRHEIKFPILAATVLMFLVSSFSAVLCLQGVIDGFIDYDGPGGALEFYNTVNGGWKHWMVVIEDSIQAILGDTLLIYRCYVLYDRNWCAIAVPFVAWLALIASSIVSSYREATLEGGKGVNDPSVLPFLSAAILLTFLTTIFTTCLIVRRLRSIAKPNWSETRIKSCSLNDLRAYMGWGAEEFRELQMHAQSTAAKMGLDTLVSPDEQDATKWARFVENCLEKFPALCKNFEDGWPIELYYLKYTHKRGYNSFYQKKKVQKPNIAEKGGSIKSQKCKENEPPSNLKKVAERALEAEVNSSRSSGNALNTFTQLFTATSRSSPVVLASFRVACVLCGFQPPISLQQKTTLREFFKGHKDLRQSFEACGIFADKYFHILLHLSTDRRERFMKSLAPGKMTHFEMVFISNMLQEHVDSTGRAKKGDLRTAPQGRKMEVSRPPRSILSFFCSLKCNDENIKKRMEIADEEEYLDLMRMVEDMVPRYLDIVPFENQHQSKVQGLVKLIRQARPSIQRYEELWPLEVLIKRFLSAQLAGLSGTLHGPDSEIEHECPLQHIYPANQVPPALSALLSDYGMEELGPAFLFLGVHSDESFAGMAGSHKLKTQLLANTNLKHLQLTEFQRMMMSHILEAV